MSKVHRLVLLVILAALVTAGAAACSSGSDGTTLRLGYFPNVTHSTAIVAVENGLLEAALPEGVTLDTKTFNAGPDVVTAILSDSLDASFIGPNPAINGYAQSEGDGLRVVAGAASGGAFLVVKPDIAGPEDLEGKKIATPQLGNTQDVALRAWLKEQGYESDSEGGGDVSVVPQENAQTLQTFIDGSIDGAWVPEPWATRLVDEGDGEILLDEASLWPDGQYVTTHLIVRTEYLEQHPDIVKSLVEASVEANDLIAGSRADAEAIVAEGIENVTNAPIPPELVTASFDAIEFTSDPIASSLLESAADAQEVGLLDPVDDLEGIYDLSILNEVLEEKGRPPIEEP